MKKRNSMLKKVIKLIKVTWISSLPNVIQTTINGLILVKSTIVLLKVKMNGEKKTLQIVLLLIVNVNQIINHVQLLGNVMIFSKLLLMSSLIITLIIKTNLSIQKMPSMMNISEFLLKNVILMVMELS